MNNEIQVTERVVSEDDAKIVLLVEKDYPEAVAAVVQFQESMAKSADSWRKMVTTLRKADLPPRHLTVLLLARGFAKQSASKIKTVVECPEPIYQLYAGGEVGFKPTLEGAREVKAAARGKSAVGISGDIAEAFRNLVNGYNGAMPKRKAVLAVERLDWVWSLTLTSKARKAGRKAGKGASGAKPQVRKTKGKHE